MKNPITIFVAAYVSYLLIGEWINSLGHEVNGVYIIGFGLLIFLGILCGALGSVVCVLRRKWFRLISHITIIFACLTRAMGVAQYNYGEYYVKSIIASASSGACSDEASDYGTYPVVCYKYNSYPIISYLIKSNSEGAILGMSSGSVDDSLGCKIVEMRSTTHMIYYVVTRCQ